MNRGAFVTPWPEVVSWLSDALPAEAGWFGGTTAAETALRALIELRRHPANAIELLGDRRVRSPKLLRYAVTKLGRAAIAQVPPNGLRQFCLLCLQQGIWEAGPMFESALEAHPQFAELHAIAAIFFRKAGNQERAMQLAVRGCELRRTWDTLTALAQAHAARSEMETAIALYDEASELRPDDISADLDVADLQWRQGRLEEACRRYERVLDKKPGSLWARGARAFLRVVLYDDAPSRQDLVETGRDLEEGCGGIAVGLEQEEVDFVALLYMALVDRNAWMKLWTHYGRPPPVCRAAPAEDRDREDDDEDEDEVDDAPLSAETTADALARVVAAALGEGRALDAVSTLEDWNVRLSLGPSGLACRAPEGFMTPALRHCMVDHQQDLKEALGRLALQTYQWQRTRLHRAALDGDVAECLRWISNGARVDASDENGLTPLHLAASSGHLEAVRLLLRSGAVDSPAHRGQTALRIALQSNHPEVAALITATFEKSAG